jgi:hypothetical protein
VVVWPLLDRKYGFSRNSGSEFTICFELSSKPVALTSNQPSTHLWALLDGDQKRAAKEIHKRALTNLPPSPDRIARLFGGKLRSLTLPWEDVWFRYGTIDDVARWAEFLTKTLLIAVDRYTRKAGLQATPGAKLRH